MVARSMHYVKRNDPIGRIAAPDKAAELKRITAEVDPILEPKAEPYLFSSMITWLAYRNQRLASPIPSTKR